MPRRAHASDIERAAMYRLKYAWKLSGRVNIGGASATYGPGESGGEIGQNVGV